jgi:cytochrome c
MRRAAPCGVAIVCVVALTVTTAFGTEREGDAQRGKALYDSRCTSCHSLDHSRIGPAHRGVFGRHAGQVVGFEYSPALRRSHVVWNAKALDRWLSDPELFIPGQKMGYTVPGAQDRADIIAFLESPGAR